MRFPLILETAPDLHWVPQLEVTRWCVSGGLPSKSPRQVVFLFNCWFLMALDLADDAGSSSVPWQVTFLLEDF